MKNIATMVLVFLVTLTCAAQTVNDTMSEADINKKLLADLNKRYPDTKKEVIVWDNTLYGYDALYTVKNTDFLTRYNKQGRYLETLTKKEWDANVPVAVKSAYDKNLSSTYNLEEYWEVNDPGRKGYYLELKDKQGQPKKIWIDDKGKVFDAPVYK